MSCFPDPEILILRDRSYVFVELGKTPREPAPQAPRERHEPRAAAAS